MYNRFKGTFSQKSCKIINKIIIREAVRALLVRGLALRMQFACKTPIRSKHVVKICKQVAATTEIRGTHFT
jgi:hypothetical protein